MFRRRRAALLFAIMGAGPMPAFAQNAGPDAAPAPSPSPPPESAESSAASALEGPRQGDRWNYELTDDITGDVTQLRTDTVVEVTDKEIVMRATLRGQQGFQTIIFDHNWGRLDNMVWKSTPNDGLGIPTRLEPGKEWRTEATSANLRNGTILRSSTRGKVVDKETLTTKAGTFDVYKIVFTTRETNTADPTKSSDTVIDLYYAPSINHWVRRHAAVRIDKRLRNEDTLELVDYSRKP